MIVILRMRSGRGELRALPAPKIVELSLIHPIPRSLVSHVEERRAGIVRERTPFGADKLHAHRLLPFQQEHRRLVCQIKISLPNRSAVKEEHTTQGCELASLFRRYLRPDRLLQAGDQTGRHRSAIAEHGHHLGEASRRQLLLQFDQGRHHGASKGVPASLLGQKAAPDLSVSADVVGRQMDPVDPNRSAEIGGILHEGTAETLLLMRGGYRHALRAENTAADV